MWTGEGSTYSFIGSRREGRGPTNISRRLIFDDGNVQAHTIHVCMYCSES